MSKENELIKEGNEAKKKNGIVEEEHLEKLIGDKEDFTEGGRLVKTTHVHALPSVFEETKKVPFSFADSVRDAARFAWAMHALSLLPHTILAKELELKAAGESELEAGSDLEIKGFINDYDEFIVGGRICEVVRGMHCLEEIPKKSLEALKERWGRLCGKGEDIVVLHNNKEEFSFFEEVKGGVLLSGGNDDGSSQIIS